jgi:hypothetical protein
MQAKDRYTLKNFIERSFLKTVKVNDSILIHISAIGMPPLVENP